MSTWGLSVVNACRSRQSGGYGGGVKRGRGGRGSWVRRRLLRAACEPRAQGWWGPGLVGRWLTFEEAHAVEEEGCAEGMKEEGLVEANFTKWSFFWWSDDGRWRMIGIDGAGEHPTS